jgi:hypothetical protein
MLHRNGTPPAPDAVRGRPLAGPARTEFLPDRPADTPRTWIYHLGRQQLLGFPAMRWLYVLLLAAGLLLPLFLPASGWLGPLLALAAIAALWLWQRLARRSAYVRFTPEPPPHISPWPLSPSDKLPVYVSGTLSVENKVRRFASLPGFYRTFATREHALLCHARSRRFAGIASWPEEEQGLWYAFLHAEQVCALRTGEIAFDRAVLKGFAIEYQPLQPLDGKSRRGGPQRVTLYIAFPQVADYEAALADLAVEPAAATKVQSSSV